MRASHEVAEIDDASARERTRLRTADRPGPAIVFPPTRARFGVDTTLNRHADVTRTIFVASQDPPSVPASLIELSSQIILHKFNSPNWLKHIQKANSALASLTPEKLSTLKPGEAYVWSSKATDIAFCQGALRIRCRPRVTHHGGATETAVD